MTRFGAAVPVANDHRFLPAVLGQLLKVCDRVAVLRSTKAFSGIPLKLEPLPKLDPRVEVFEDCWENEGATRNAGMEILSDCDYFFTVDADEIFTLEDLEFLKSKSVGHRAVACLLHTYWKSPRWEISPPERIYANVVAHKLTRFAFMRVIDGGQHLIGKQLIHHLSYVRTDEEVKEKLRLFAHAHQIQKDWYENVWKRWDTNHDLRCLNPVNPQSFGSAVAVKSEALERVLSEYGIVCDEPVLAKAASVNTIIPQQKVIPQQQVNIKSTKPKICLISDVPGWAFDQNNRDLAEYLSDTFEFSHYYACDPASRPDWNSFDGIFELYHKNPKMGIPYHKTAGALRSEWFNTEQPLPPTPADIALVNKHAVFQVAVKRNYDELIAKCPNVVYLTNPINMRRFPTSTPLRNNIVAEWNGNAAHKAQGRFIKHFRDIILPACAQAGVQLVSAEYNTTRRKPEEMPAFYQQANVALCASEYEAASNSLLEGMASGLAVIATDVGNHREMYDSQMKEFGKSGILLVPGSVPAFIVALKSLTPEQAHEMGKINRAEIEARWSWDVWRKPYLDFLWRTVRK